MSETATALAPPTPPALPEQVTRRGVNEAQWRTLVNNLFPGANPNSVLMVLDYCAARRLDPMKKPCHIVPMEVKDFKTGEYVWRDVVMPGVYEYRITAQRTGEYLGHEPVVYGEEAEFFGLKVPESATFTVYRWNRLAGMKVPYTATVFFSEVVATKKDRKTGEVYANARWTRAPRQMLAKCAEAAALREAFPEEIGGEPTEEEMHGQRHSGVATPEDDDVIQGAVVTALDRIPDGMRDNMDRAFAALGLTQAQRLVRANEFLGGDADPEEGAQRLLDWCAEELKGKTSATQKRKADNGKRRSNAPAGDSTGSAAPASAASAPASGSGESTAPQVAVADRSGDGGSAPAAEQPAMKASAVADGDLF